MTDRERITDVEDDKIPAGFEVTFHTLVGFNTTDRWYTAHLPDGSTIEFGDQDACINACIAHDTNMKRPLIRGSPFPDGKTKKEEPDDSIEASWRDLGYPRLDCVTCNKTVNEDGSKVLWRCSVCGHLVCMQCTRTIGNLGREYHEQTLCSDKCWISAGGPSE
jgi:hypothetical protein